MKKLSKEGRFECGLDDVVKGKVWAFTPVHRDGHWGLGVAIANEPGYLPIPLTWAHVEEGPGAHEAMADHADELNLAEGITADAAARVVASTMRGCLASRR